MFLTFVFLLSVVTADFYDDTTCFRALCTKETNCTNHVCRFDEHGREGCGPFLLNKYQYNNCYLPQREEHETEEQAWKACAKDYHCSVGCIRTLKNKVVTKCYGKAKCEKIARVYHGGSGGCLKTESKFYWVEVQKICDGKC